MTLGKVKWFGGLNKNTGQVNNFGFIDAIDNTHHEGIYISRRDVPSHIQPLLEPGTYVEFDLRENERGKKYAVNIEMVLLVGTVEWFKGGRGYVKCDSYDDIRIESLEEFEPRSILSFFVKSNSRFNRNEAFLPQRVDYSTQDKTIIELCSKSSQSEICVPFIASYAKLLPEDAAIKFVVNKIDALASDEQQSVLCDLLKQAEELFLISPELRQKVITDRGDGRCNNRSPFLYWQFIDKYILSFNNLASQALLAEVRGKLNSASEETRSTYWQHSSFLRSSLKYKGNLWEFAPVGVKSDLIRQRYTLGA